MTDTATTTLEHVDVDVDLDKDIACEYWTGNGEDHPADYLVRIKCPHCGKVDTGGICHHHYERLMLMNVEHECGHRCRFRDHVEIVERLR